MRGSCPSRFLVAVITVRSRLESVSARALWTGVSCSGLPRSPFTLERDSRLGSERDVRLGNQSVNAHVNHYVWHSCFRGLMTA
ncbi:uncharacterized protein BDZ99DRAFT_38377 [Mytilinidion resinicola]|uniref:Uncharacterized protein n=1 Tax=Mytilinidion resinicola TaxID=574789 RepID=A0A6A6YJK1_9PEZI|nr:uncharacterized protein BDZ99DRAFT_38377 [Mytilinidion resinicola]KAF2808728.1 hypothetical protein BDZ99DRAFT_38377 [Mytilinidion resinicola]